MVYIGYNIAEATYLNSWWKNKLAKSLVILLCGSSTTIRKSDAYTLLLKTIEPHAIINLLSYPTVLYDIESAHYETTLVKSLWKGDNAYCSLLVSDNSLYVTTKH